VYSREIDGQVLTLSASGWTYDFVFVLYDSETGSMWLPVSINDPGIENGCGCVLWSIAGDFAGQMVPALLSSNTVWNIWFSEHPDTKVLIDPQLMAK
jgi:hypothetical protein